jgi:hypothetical protein
MRSLVLVVVLLAGCAAGQGSSPTEAPAGSPAPTAAPATTEPSATPTEAPTTGPTALPSPSPSPTASPVAVDLATASIARVLADNLSVYEGPPTSGSGQTTGDTLSSGDLVYVVDDAADAAGSRWYEVAQVTCCSFGWIPAAGPAGPQLEAATLACPSTPLGAADIAAIDFGSLSLGLLCFGDRPFTLTARLAAHEATCGVSPGWTTVPRWLGPCEPHDYITNLRGAFMSNYFDAVLAPSVSTKTLHYGIDPQDWLRVRITGQFDYPAARTCRGVKQDSDPPPPASVILRCRSIFVITAIAPA